MIGLTSPALQCCLQTKKPLISVLLLPVFCSSESKKVGTTWFPTSTWFKFVSTLLQGRSWSVLIVWHTFHFPVPHQARSNTRSWASHCKLIAYAILIGCLCSQIQPIHAQLGADWLMEEELATRVPAVTLQHACSTSRRNRCGVWDCVVADVYLIYTFYIRTTPKYPASNRATTRFVICPTYRLSITVSY